MSGLETAIRSALDRSDRTNAELRARIYQSARQALEAGLRKQNISDPQVIEEQRHRLEAMIHDIEQEERSRQAIIEPSVDEIAAAMMPRDEDIPDVDGVRPGHSDDQRSLDTGTFDGLRADRDAPGQVDDAIDSPRATGPKLDVKPEAVIRRKKKRSGVVARLFIFVMLLSAAGAGAWWVYTSDLLLTPAERDTSVPNPQPRAEEEDFLGEPQPSLGATETQQGFSEEWLPVFEPAQIASIQPRANAAVDIVGSGEDQAARILARSADADGTVSIAVPVEVLREMAGKTSTIALTLKSDGEAPVQISVECDFDRLGDCARHRFTAHPERGDVLFQVTFDRTIAPGTPGALIVNADLGGGGGGIDLYGIRVLPGR